MKKTALILLCFLPSLTFAQDQSFSSKINPYEEAQNAIKTDTLAWKNTVNSAQFYFASSNIHYAKEQIPSQELQPSWKTKAWKGERIHTQLVYYNATDVPNLHIQTSELTNDDGQKFHRI